MSYHTLVTLDGTSRDPHSSIGSSGAPVPGPWLFPDKVAVAGQSIALAVLVISFGRYRLLPNQRLILDGNRPLHLGSRAFDILVMLVERAGELVSKDELRQRVWPDTVVDDSNLKVQVATLRRALREGQNGNRYIATVTGHGYWFVAPVVRSTGTMGEVY